MKRTKKKMAFVSVAMCSTLLVVFFRVGCSSGGAKAIIATIDTGTPVQIREVVQKHKGSLDTKVNELVNLGAGEPYIHTTSPLLSAAEEGNLVAIQALVSQGANINIQDHLGWTPLIHAARYRHDEVIAYLLDQGADLTLRSGVQSFSMVIGGNPKWTALEWAASFGTEQSAQLILEASVRTGQPVDLNGAIQRASYRNTLGPQITAMLKEHQTKYPPVALDPASPDK